MKCQLLPVLVVQVPNLIILMGSHWISLRVSHDCVRPDVHKTLNNLCSSPILRVGWISHMHSPARSS